MSGRSGPRASASAMPVREIVVATAVLTCVRQRRACLGPKGLSERQNTTSEPADAPARADRMPVKGAAQMDREQPDPLQNPALARPQELVGLDTPQHVELAGALVGGRADRKAQQLQTDAVRLETIVEGVLIEVEPPAVVEAVHHRGGLAVQAQDVHPQPAAVERAPG